MKILSYVKKIAENFSLKVRKFYSMVCIFTTRKIQYSSVLPEKLQSFLLKIMKMSSKLDIIKHADAFFVFNRGRITSHKAKEVSDYSKSEFDPDSIRIRYKDGQEFHYSESQLFTLEELDFIPKLPENPCEVGTIVELNSHAKLVYLLLKGLISLSKLKKAINKLEDGDEDYALNIFVHATRRTGLHLDENAKIIHVRDENGLQVASVLPNNLTFGGEIDIPLSLCTRIDFALQTVTSNVEIPGVISKGEVLTKIDDFYQSDLGTLLLHESEINLIKGDARICKR